MITGRDQIIISSLEWDFLWRHWHPRKAQKAQYDFRLLEQLLREAGFSKVTRCERGESSMLDREFLDGDPSESLYLEARP